MKRLLVVILVMAVLVAMVTGCGRAPRYDGRLVAADSLMRSNPDSALALVEGVCRDSLSAECDRAYRDLLLTQARYRCYVTATSDSDINRALAYYRAHQGEREKLTRAYIYKGAVMEELNHPDSAMLYYKHAEAVTNPDDYYNLGYCNLRIVDLFLNEVTEDSSVVERIHKAVKCFEKMHDTTLLISTFGRFGTVYGNTAPDSAKYYLWHAIRLAHKFDSTQQYTNESKLAGVYLFQKEYPEANALAMDVLRNGKEHCLQNQFYFYAAMSFIKMGMIDSAKYVMGLMPPPRDKVDSMAYYDLSAELSKAEGQMEQYGKNLYSSKQVESKIYLSSRDGELMVIDSEFEHLQSESRNTVVIKRNRAMIFASVVLLLILSLFIFWLWRRQRTYIHEKASLTAQFEQAMAALEEQRRSATNPDINEVIRLRLSAIQELYQDIRVKINDDNKVRKIVPLSSFLKMMHEHNTLLDLELKNTFWKKMRSSVDAELNGIVTYVEQRYPELTTRDLQFFTLICAKISPQLIKLCMNITNAKTVTNYRTLIIKKIGLDKSIDDFVNDYLAGTLK